VRRPDDTHLLLLTNLFRLTALELKTLQIPSTMIVDTMVGSLFQHHNIHAVGMFLTLRLYPPALVHEPLLSAVGADRIAKNGDTANKVHCPVFHASLCGSQ
jgi:methylthioribose-1-phosphate isomerase